MAITTEASGVAPPEAISNVIRKTGSRERGDGSLALSDIPASPVVADMTAGAERLVQEITREHELAQAARDTAIEHAIRCGRLLLEQKARLEHGDFQPWIEAHCRFAYSTAARYMTAARRISQGIEISSLTGLFPSSGKTERGRTERPTPEAPPKILAREIPGTTACESHADPTIEQAADILRRKDDAHSLRLLREYRTATRELERARIAHANAAAHVIAAARQLAQSAAEAPARTPDAEPARVDTPTTDWEPRGAEPLPKSTALQFSCEAMGLLGKIPPDDRLRNEALDDVVRWVKANR